MEGRACLHCLEDRHTGTTTKFPGLIVAGCQHAAATGSCDAKWLPLQIRTLTQFNRCVETILVHMDDSPHRLSIKLERLGRVASGKPELRIAQGDFAHYTSRLQEGMSIAHTLEREHLGM